MFITVFTPTFNRAGLLPRLYEGLRRQPFSDFEWLIVDDGSTDNTSEVVEGFIGDGAIRIRYLRTENRGKYRAFNLAMEMAEGDWLFCVDSDDFPATDALAHLRMTSSHADDDDCAIVGMKSDADGNSLSRPTLVDPKGKCTFSAFRDEGEYSIVLRTEIVRGYPFPDIEGENFVTEDVLYDALDLAGYSCLRTDRVLTICEYQPEGLSASVYRLMMQNPTGFLIYHMQRIDLACSFRERVGHILRYHAFRCMSAHKEYRYRGKHSGFVTLLAPLGPLGVLYYKMRKSRQK